MPVVIVRLRSSPCSSVDRCVSISNPNTLLVENSDTRQGFTFDMIAPESATQQQLFSSVRESFHHVVSTSLAVNNKSYQRDHLVMGCGQEGAGKSYTLFGHKTQEGLMVRLVDMLVQKEYQVRLTAFKLFNDQFHDLLERFNGHSQRPNKKVFIKEDYQRNISIQNLIKVVVKKQTKVMALVEGLLACKYTREGVSTHDDRRSHKVLTLNISHPDLHPTREVKIHFVQLASSDGDRDLTRRKSLSANKSLSALNMVLSNLMDLANGKPKRYVPYRDSKLTLYLKEMLSNSLNSKWIFTNVFTDRSRLTETVNSLVFAKRAKSSVNDPITANPPKESVKNIRMEVKAMRIELEKSRFLHSKSIQSEWEEVDVEGLESELPTPPQLTCQELRQLNQNTTGLRASMPGDSKAKGNFKQVYKMLSELLIYVQTGLDKKDIETQIYNELNSQYSQRQGPPGLSAHFPSFVGVVDENNRLRSTLLMLRQEAQCKNHRTSQLDANVTTGSSGEHGVQLEVQVLRVKIILQQQILSEYEKTLEQLKEGFIGHINQVKLDHQNDIANSDYCNDIPLQMRLLRNQNKCLKLTILTQQEQIQRLHREYSFISAEIKALTDQNRQLGLRRDQIQTIMDKGGLKGSEIADIMDKLIQIKDSIQRDDKETNQTTSCNIHLQDKIRGPKQSQVDQSTTKNQVHAPYTCRDNHIDSFAGLQPQNKGLRRKFKDSEDKRTLLQRQVLNLSSKSADLRRQLALSKQTEISLYQQLSNCNQKVRALETKEKVHGQKYKRQSLEIAILKKQLQQYTEKAKLLKSQFNKSQYQILEQYRLGSTSRRLSLRKAGSMFDVVSSVKSSFLDLQKSLNTTSINQMEKILSCEIPRMSNGRKLLGRDNRKEIKPFLFKSKQIKNSIVQKV